MVNGSPRLCGVFLFLHTIMRKKSLKLVKSIVKAKSINEAIADPEAHTWETPHPADAWQRLSPDQQAHVQTLHQQGRLHQDGHLHGWRPGTGPLFGRDFHGRSAEDYKTMYRRLHQDLMSFGHSHDEAHQQASEHVNNVRQQAHEQGNQAHNEAMREIRLNERKKQQAAQNVSGAQKQQQYKQDAETLHGMALKGARESEEYFRTGTQAVRDAWHKTSGDKLSPSMSEHLDKVHPQLSEEAKKHLSTLTGMARRAIHATVIGGLNKASEGFNADAREHWRKTFSGMSPTDAGIRSPHDVLFSALTPEHVRHMIDRYEKRVTSPDNISGWPGLGHHSTSFIHTYGHSELSGPANDMSKEHYGSPDRAGAAGHGDLHTTIPNISQPYHPSLGHHVTVNTYHDIIGTLIAREKYKKDSIAYKFRQEIPTFHIHGATEAQNAAMQETAKTLNSGVKTGTDFIKNLQGISDDDRKILFRHFESQLRHHHVAAVANPKMYDAHHQGKSQQEREAEGRQRKQREEQQRQSSGGSGGSSGGGGRRRRGEWPHPEQPHEILGIAPDASASDVRRAYRKLAAQHHPDAGGDPAMFIKAKDAHDHMMKKHGLNEWVIFTAEWIGKRYRK